MPHYQPHDKDMSHFPPLVLCVQLQIRNLIIGFRPKKKPHNRLGMKENEVTTIMMI